MKNKTIALLLITLFTATLFIGCSDSMAVSYEIPKEPKPYVAPGETPQRMTPEQSNQLSNLLSYSCTQGAGEKRSTTFFLRPGTYNKDGVLVGTVIKGFSRNGNSYTEFRDSDNERHLITTDAKTNTIVIDGRSYEFSDGYPKIDNDADSKAFDCSYALTGVAESVNVSEFDHALFEGLMTEPKKVSGQLMEFNYANEKKTFVDYTFDDGTKLEYAMRNSTEPRNKSFTFIRLNGGLLNPEGFDPWEIIL